MYADHGVATEPIAVATSDDVVNTGTRGMGMFPFLLVTLLVFAHTTHYHTLLLTAMSEVPQ